MIEIDDAVLDLLTVSGNGNGGIVDIGDTGPTSTSAPVSAAIPFTLPLSDRLAGGSTFLLPTAILEEFQLHRDGAGTFGSVVFTSNPTGNGSGDDGAFDALSDGVMDLRTREKLGVSSTDSGGDGAGKYAGVGVDGIKEDDKVLPRCLEAPLGPKPASFLVTTGVGGLADKPVGWTSLEILLLVEREVAA